MNPKTLICVATPIEAQACKRGIALSGRENDFEVLQTGMGIVRARSALDARLKNNQLQRPAMIISSGLAGSRHPSLKVGSWVTAKTVEFENEGKTLNCSNHSFSAERLSFHLNSVRFITLLTAETQNKTASSQKGPPVAVDMESHAWAEICLAHQIPFQILRVISDNPDSPLPESVSHFAGALNADALIDQLSGFARGLSKLATAPHHMARFLVQSAKLPKVLEQGWKELAQE